MKRNTWKRMLCLVSTLVVLLCGCGAAPGEGAGERYTFNPHLYIPTLAQEIPQEYWDSFYNLCDALRKGETTFACSGEDAYKWVMSPSTLTELFPAACTRVKGEGSDGTVPFENGVGRIYYQIPPEEYVERQAAFEAKIEEILNTCLEPDDDPFEKCLKLYDYISAEYSYDYDFQEVMPDGANYLAIMTGKGQCLELGSVYAYYLLQAGVEAFQVGCNNRTMAHAWTCIVMNGKQYHSDPTWALRNPEEGERLPLYYFLMSDSRRDASGCAVDDLTAPVLPRYWFSNTSIRLSATDESLSFPSGSELLWLDEENKTVYYIWDDAEQNMCYAGGTGDAAAESNE